MKPRPLIHRTHIVRIHGSPGEAISLDEYIETERAHITADRLRELSGFSAWFMHHWMSSRLIKVHSPAVRLRTILKQ